MALPCPADESAPIDLVHVRPLDELTVEDLDEMLKRYSSVIDESTREALKQVLADFKKSLVDLQKELASLMSNFGDLTRP